MPFLCVGEARTLGHEYRRGAAEFAMVSSALEYHTAPIHGPGRHPDPGRGYADQRALPSGSSKYKAAAGTHV